MTEELKPTENKKNPITSNPFIMGLLGGMITCAIIFVAQTFIVDHQPKVVTVDIRKLVELKRDELIKRYNGAYTSENAKIAEAELLEFNNLIEAGLKKVGGGRVVFIKDVVLGNSIDKTDELLKYIQKNQTEKDNDRKARQ